MFRLCTPDTSTSEISDRNPIDILFISKWNEDLSLAILQYIYKDSNSKGSMYANQFPKFVKHLKSCNI